jgi:hypothetical protein
MQVWMRVPLAALQSFHHLPALLLFLQLQPHAPHHLHYRRSHLPMPGDQLRPRELLPLCLRGLPSFQPPGSLRKMTNMILSGTMLPPMQLHHLDLNKEGGICTHRPRQEHLYHRHLRNAPLRHHHPVNQRLCLPLDPHHGSLWMSTEHQLLPGDRLNLVECPWIPDSLQTTWI